MNIIPKPKKIELSNNFVALGEVSSKASADLEREEYKLTIDENGVSIIGGSDRAIYYGLSTLEQIKREYGSNAPKLTISDKPSYKYRGFMIDSCRHFFSVDEVKRMIDIASILKFNYFHFHLSDDQGFRVEIDSWDKLTAIASRREGSHFGKAENDDTPYQFYYTKDELRDIVAYCKERYIEVIPELDIPGHTSAILSAYPELSCEGKPVKAKQSQGVYKDLLCAGNDLTLKMICDVIDEMCEIFDGKYFHIGGDEAPKDKWEACPKCQAKIKALGLKNEEELHCHLVNEASSYLKSKGKSTIVWNEAGVGGNLNDDITMAFWMDKTSTTADWANRGNPVIIEKFNPYYADYPYGMFPLKSTYNHNPKSLKGLTEKGKASIIGIETPIWTEYVTSFDQMTYMCFPRWFAVSDTAWNGNDNKNYKEFEKSAISLCEHLNSKGIKTAPKRDWNPNPLSRLGSTLKFANNLMTKNMIKQLLKMDVEEK